MSQPIPQSNASNTPRKMSRTNSDPPASTALGSHSVQTSSHNSKTPSRFSPQDVALNSAAPTPKPIHRRMSHSVSSSNFSPGGGAPGGSLKGPSSAHIELLKLQAKQRSLTQNQQMRSMSLSFAQISNGGVLSGKSSINSLQIRDSEGTLVQPRNRRNTIQNPRRPPSKLSNSAQFEEEPEKLKVPKEVPDAIIKSVAGNSLRGPTILQMIANYLFFLLLLGIAIQSNWAPFIRFYQLVLLVIISFVAIQISRIWQTKDQNTVLVFYLSLIPFTYLIVISREVHTITLLLWYSSILAIFLQSGIPNLSFHISVYSALGIFLYGGAVAFMKQFFRAKCPFPICGQPLKPPIDDRVEIILVCAVIALVINCRFLDNYIKLNAIALLDRDNFLKQLYTANADLRRQIHQERQSDILDLESPLTKVLQILGEIRDSDAADAYMVKELDRLMKILNSDQLYTPDIFQKSADADVSEWLKSMMQAPKHEVASATASLESGFDETLMIHGIPGTQGPTVTFSLIADSQVITLQESKIIEMLHDIDNPNFDVA
ncbi:High affinity cAMP-specific 3',5'-cyclic phosphodiesterase 7A, partial [Chytriomyces hyalinus]